MVSGDYHRELRRKSIKPGVISVCVRSTKVLPQKISLSGTGWSTLTKKENSLFFSVTDTIYRQLYNHTSAEVIENSVNRQKNFFTINKGTRQGIIKGYGSDFL